MLLLQAQVVERTHAFVEPVDDGHVLGGRLAEHTELRERFIALVRDALAQFGDAGLAAVENQVFEYGLALGKLAAFALALAQLRVEQSQARFVAAVLELQQRGADRGQTRAARLQALEPR